MSQKGAALITYIMQYIHSYVSHHWRHPWEWLVYYTIILITTGRWISGLLHWQILFPFSSCIIIVPHKIVLTETLLIVTVEVVNRRSWVSNKKNKSARRLNLVWKTGLYVMTIRVILPLCTICIRSVENMFWIKDM